MEPCSMEDFKSLSPREQVDIVCEALQREDWLPLEWFCEMHDPRVIQPPLNDDLASALENYSLLKAVVLEALNVPRQFVTLMRLWSRIG